MPYNRTALTKKIETLATYIEENLAQSLGLKEFAEEVSMSPFHLQRQFKKIYGLSPKQFQNALRIQRVKQSLKKGCDVTSAIYEAGFGSPSRLYEQLDNQLGMTPASYKQGAAKETISFAIRTTQIGRLIMAATNRGVCFVHFADTEAALLSALNTEFPSATLQPTADGMDEQLDLWIQALERHFASASPLPALPLALHGTAFQFQVWRFLSQLKTGETVTYQTIAKGIGKPKAYRAVANACAANRVAVLIPCHRVLRGDGQLGGYRWGVERKQALLTLEAEQNQIT